jgi:hypothetical protein
MRRFVTVALILLPFVSGCRPAEPIDIRKTSDLELDCPGLYREIGEAEKHEAEAREVSGSLWRNTMAIGLFGLPGMMTQQNRNNTAIDSARDRKANLQQIAAKKGCQF